MKKQWKGFLAGMLVTVMTLGMINPAVAALVGRTIEVYTGVNVYVDDQLIEPKDANGNPVEVFVYNGTTYLPIRAIGNALGLPVEWEGKSQSAYVGKHKGDKPNVWLKDLDYFTGRSWGEYDGKDNLGVEHRAAITDNRWSETNTSNTYLINGQYSAISGTLFQKYDDRSKTDAGYPTIFEIYGDDELLYSAEMYGGIKPIDFYVSLSGVLELRVCLHTKYANDYFNRTAIADCGLWT